MSDVSFVRAVPDDAPTLAHMHAESFGVECWNANQMRGSLILSTTKGWIASIDGVHVGFILCQTVGAESEVLTFCVRPPFRGKGCGKSLLVYAVGNLCPPSDAIYLEVAEDNICAKNLYEKCGFIKNGFRPNYYQRGGSKVNAVLYRYISNN
ncbi:MAG: GNAT family N-acetyltransferase [Alphaproteobacteria bacterium]|nr:GNAT family N-acetyltransferase [Alphaproteobacteria bacterium]